MTGAYTLGAVCAPAAVVALELMALRTGILRRGRFWVTIAITLAFQVPVDGWLTKLSAPSCSTGRRLSPACGGHGISRSRTSGSRSP